MTGRTLAETGTQIRSQRAHLKRRIAAGEIDVPALLAGQVRDDVEAVALGVPVVSLLRAMPGFGPAHVHGIVGDRPMIGPHTRLADLTTRTRRQIADEIRKATTP